jgi:hypothetical protein
MKPKPAARSRRPQQRETVLKQFRAYLHLAITAHQTGQTKKLKTLGGPDLLAYCRELAEWPDHSLACELAAPVTAILQQLDQIAPQCEGILRSQDEPARSLRGSAKLILAQVDLAFGFILRRLNHQLALRGEVATDTDFLCEAIGADTGAGARIARMIRRFYQLHPKELNGDDGSFFADFAWDVYQRVAELDRLADDFPGQIRVAARQMPAWPMLRHRHTGDRRRFRQLAKRLELGAEYPTDATESARFRPDSPLVRYLEPIICRLHLFYCDRNAAVGRGSSPAEQDHLIARRWRQWPEELPGADLLRILNAVCRLPPLTKATALQWAETAVVPLILATDARDYANCAEPVLRKIATQKGVKTQGTFNSRLRAAVVPTLRRLARPA